MIPSYLKEISKEIYSDKKSTKIQIKCTCGCDDFKLFKRRKSKEEIEIEKQYEKQLIKEFGRGLEMQSDSNGKVFMIRRNFFGKIIKKVEIDKLDIPVFKNYIRAKCNYCGEEFTLFDENIHGYDAIVSKPKAYLNNEIYNYSNDSNKVEIIIYYNDDNEDDDLIEDKSLAFGRIKIIKNNNHKKVTYFDFECE